MGGGYTIFGAEGRRLKSGGGYSSYGSEDRRWKGVIGLEIAIGPVV